MLPGAPGAHFTIGQYADDSTCFVKDQFSLEQLFRVIHLFELQLRTLIIGTLDTSRHCTPSPLITYSQADEQIVSSRESFAVIVLDAFENSDPETQSRVVQWVCSEESHKNGGIHYHMAVKLDCYQRWLKVRNYVDTKHGIKLHFSSVHANYYSAWKYATKEDKQYFQSPDHPDLKSPKTQKASQTRVGNGKKKEQKASKRKRKARLSVFDVSQLVVE